MTTDAERIARLEAQIELLTRMVGNESPAYSASDAPNEAMLAHALQKLEPLQPLLQDTTINDILINGPRSVYIERGGKLQKTDVVFPDDSQVFELARAIASQVRRNVDPRRPLVDARLLDGSRVNIIAPPLAVDGTSISIRKFPQHEITLESMIQSQNLSHGLAEFLKVAAKSKLNIIISGGTGSGKTTLLNAISRYIGNDERIVTIEDAAELQLQQPHVVRLETKPIAIGENKDEEVTIRDLVKNALRMRPDRIIVGEVRGPEAFDMMQAMNTGHEGSLTSVHANHPRDAVSRIENMINMANLNLSASAVKQQIASAVHLIVQISRQRDGHRRIQSVTEIVGMESDIITMQELFQFQPKGEHPSGRIEGDFRWTGIVPRFIRRAAYYGEADRLSAALGTKLPRI